MGPEHLGQGWHSGATTGVFGAAAAAAAGLGLDEEKAVHALGIAGTQASGLMAAQYGAMVKRMHAGRAAQSGLYGAARAERGFTGIVNVFESEYGGFCTTFSNSTDRFNLKELTAGLGRTFPLMEIFLKFYSCVGGVHPTLDAIRELREKRAFTADEVEKVTVDVSQISVDHSGWKYRPEGVTSAQLNMSYCLATMLIEGECFVDQFSEDLVADPARLAMIERIEIKHDPEITALGRPYRHKVHVEVRLKDGAVAQDHDTKTSRSDEVSKRRTRHQEVRYAGAPRVCAAAGGSDQGCGTRTRQARRRQGAGAAADQSFLGRRGKLISWIISHEQFDRRNHG